MTNVKWLTELIESLPLVNYTDTGPVYEWWHGSRKLTIYYGEKVEYVKVWGPDIDNEMEEGVAGSLDELELLWRWLTEGGLSE